MDTRVKILPQENAEATFAAAALNGRRTAVAGGWFDVLQAEHCRRLAQAKKSCARLVVFVYNDGPRRQGLLDAYSRAQMVAALAVVDYVVICDEAEAASLAVRWNLPPLLPIEEAMPRDIVADVLQRHQFD